MELKRVLTKRIRMRKANTPDKIELPTSKYTGPPQDTSGLPDTPVTPGVEEFMSIPFEESTQQPPSPAKSFPRMTESTRSSRSASVNSKLESLQSSPIAPVISFEFEQEAMSPASMEDTNESDADEMAQQILEKVQQGGQKWCL